jgi:D-threo-aldose 1-dehydrogenase
MDIPKRKIGRTETTITELGFGSAGLGDLFDLLSEEQAQQTLQAAWDAGIRYYDTAPFYGYGKSEHRLGHFLRQQPRNDFVVSTKVGRVLKPTRNHETFDGGFWRGGLPFDFVWDYSYDGIMRSYEDSLQRLSLSCIDLLLIHDLDFGNFPTESLLNAHLHELATSGWRALDELRSTGAIKAVGAGINISGMIPRLLDVVDLDMFLVAMPYTLLDQSVLEEEFPRCAERDVGIVIGAASSHRAQWTAHVMPTLQLPKRFCIRPAKSKKYVNVTTPRSAQPRCNSRSRIHWWQASFQARSSLDTLSRMWSYFNTKFHHLSGQT